LPERALAAPQKNRKTAVRTASGLPFLRAAGGAGFAARRQRRGPTKKNANAGFVFFFYKQGVLLVCAAPIAWYC